MTAVYSFIAEEKADSSSSWAVAEMCRTLGVSRQGFYDWESRPPSARELGDRRLAVEIEAIWECSARTYGVPRVWRWLGRQGFRVSRKRVARSCATTAEKASPGAGGSGPPSSTAAPPRRRIWSAGTSTPPPRM